MTAESVKTYWKYVQERKVCLCVCSADHVDIVGVSVASVESLGAVAGFVDIFTFPLQLWLQQSA